MVETRLHLDADGISITIEHVQDVEAIIARNKRLQGEPQRCDWGRHIATIPNVVLVKWMNEEGANVLAMSGDEFGAFLRRKLDDPDWRHLRTDK
jgi:hypothetical protein